MSTKFSRLNPGLRKHFYAVMALCAMAFSLCFTSPTLAQDFPKQVIRIVVPFAAGSGTDLSAREMSQKIAEATGWNFVVDNKAGANGVIAIQEVMRAPADGYHLIMTGSTTHAANPALFKKLPYEPLGDFAPVIRTGVVPLVLFVAAKHKIQNVGELTELARKNPGKLSFATGSASHRLAAELYRQAAGINVNHVPYKGSAQALTDLIGGHVDFMFVDTSVGMAYIKAGTLTPLAVTTLKPLEALPTVPTMAASGFDGYQVSAWSGIFAPKKTPAEIVQRLNQAFNAFSDLDECAIISNNNNFTFYFIANFQIRV